MSGNLFDSPLRLVQKVCLELQYLKEIGRLTTDGQNITDYLGKAIQLRICGIALKSARIDIIIEKNLKKQIRIP